MATAEMIEEIRRLPEAEAALPPGYCLAAPSGTPETASRGSRGVVKLAGIDWTSFAQVNCGHDRVCVSSPQRAR